jgi:hypothetical protein
MKICIVGNGAGALNKANGNFIDSCECVIRIKNFQIEGYEKYVGTKIDGFSSKWFSWFDRNTKTPLTFSFLKNVNTLFFMFPNEEKIQTTINKNAYVQLYSNLQLKNELPFPMSSWTEHKLLLTKFNLMKKSIVYFDQTDIQELCCDILKLNKVDFIVSNKPRLAIIEPTCGIRTVFKVLQMYPNEEIFLTGFDGFETSWYWSPSHKINLSHHYLTERMYLKYLKKTKQVISLD